MTPHTPTATHRGPRDDPALVLDEFNRTPRPHGLFFPVDVSTGIRATLGSMSGNNNRGARSIRYANMVHDVHAIEGLLADGAGRAAAHPAERLAEALTQ